eukprot:2579065-Prymnesium_polylepis.1
MDLVLLFTVQQWPSPRVHGRYEREAESEEEFEVEEADESENKEEAPKPKGGVGEEMAVGDEFYMVVKGKAFELLSGSVIIRLAHPNAQLIDDWLDILRNTATTMYQKSPIFAQ